MAKSGLDGLFESLLKYGSLLRQKCCNYFGVDIAWEILPLQFQLLEARHEHLQELFNEYESSFSPSVLQAIKKAQLLLDREISTLEREADRACCPIGGIWSQIVRVLFPQNVEKYVRVAQDAYQHIEDQFRKPLPQLGLMRRSNFIPLVCYEHNHYIPLKDLERKLQDALEAAPPVVLLHGGPGKGKSTVTRHIGCERERMSAFSRVVILECGPQVDVTAKLMDLLQKIDSEWKVSKLDQEDTFKMVVARLEEESQTLLIILDDLCEKEFLSKLLDLSGPGAGVKYLVTSQSSGVCDLVDDEKTTVISIEDLNGDDARAILATYAHFEDQQIPANLQDVAHAAIEAAAASPLAMAIVGSLIAKAGAEILEVWQSIVHEICDKSYDRSQPITCHKETFSALKVSLHGLCDKELTLLILMSLCVTPSVPEHVVEVLYRTIVWPERCSVVHFANLRNELRSRQLLVAQDTRLGQTLSIHSLTRDFILGQMTDRVREASLLLSDNALEISGEASSRKPAISVTQLLVYLYIKGSLRRAVTDFEQPWRMKLNRAAMKSKRVAIEGIMPLLALKPRPGSDWTEELSVCIEQVFMAFILEDKFQCNDISKLLNSPRAVRHVLTFLKTVTLREETFWEPGWKECA